MTVDPLEELRERVAAAQAAAEALAEETAAMREDVPRSAHAAGSEIGALAAVAQAVRALLPEDLWEQVCDLIRGLLILVRAVLDRWIEAFGAPAPAGPVVRDIPIV